MTAGIAVEALALRLGAFRLTNIDLAVARGEVLVVLGRNGAGKSVTLETIAGFHRPDNGRVRIGGRDVTALPPEQRNVAFLVQNFGLFPHLSVAQNVAIARRRRARIATAVRDVASPPIGDDAALLAYFGVAHLAERLPAELSPGEKQRVALARALAGAPDLFLFDEPFSALDAETRAQLREELKSFLRALATPAIFVSHDRTDARALADTIAVLRDGAIVQRGAAADVFQKPTNSFVARLVGVENVLSGRIIETTESGASVEIGKQILRALAPARPIPIGSSAVLGIRGEDVVVSLPEAKGTPSPTFNQLDGRITGLRDEGPLVALAIDCGWPLRAYLLAPQARAMKLNPGCAATIEIAPAAIHVMAD